MGERDVNADLMRWAEQAAAVGPPGCCGPLEAAYWPDADRASNTVALRCSVCGREVAIMTTDAFFEVTARAPRCMRCGAADCPNAGTGALAQVCGPVVFD